MKALRVKDCSELANPGQSGSDRVNPRPRPPRDCSGSRARRTTRLRACAVPRGPVGLRDGGVHVLRPAVGRCRPEEPPAAGYTAGRRPGKSVRSSSASRVGGRGAGSRFGRGGCPRRRRVPGVVRGSAVRLRASSASRRSGSSAPRQPASSGGPARSPGCRPRLRERGWARPKEAGAVLAEGRRFRAPFG